MSVVWFIAGGFLGFVLGFFFSNVYSSWLVGIPVSLAFPVEAARTKRRQWAIAGLIHLALLGVGVWLTATYAGDDLRTGAWVGLALSALMTFAGTTGAAVEAKQMIAEMEFGDEDRARL